MEAPVIAVGRLAKEYRRGPNVVHAPRGVTVEAWPGEFVAVGSGKSTCMNLVGCLDRPTSGAHEPDGVDVSAPGKDHLALVRNPLIEDRPNATPRRAGHLLAAMATGAQLFEEVPA
jgi:ABC-type lipoprotein export system ATPase subunit